MASSELFEAKPRAGKRLSPNSTLDCNFDFDEAEGPFSPKVEEKGKVEVSRQVLPADNAASWSSMSVVQSIRLKGKLPPLRISTWEEGSEESALTEGGHFPSLVSEDSLASSRSAMSGCDFNSMLFPASSSLHSNYDASDGDCDACNACNAGESTSAGLLDEREMRFYNQAEAEYIRARGARTKSRFEAEVEVFYVPLGHRASAERNECGGEEWEDRRESVLGSSCGTPKMGLLLARGAKFLEEEEEEEEESKEEKAAAGGSALEGTR